MLDAELPTLSHPPASPVKPVSSWALVTEVPMYFINIYDTTVESEDTIQRWPQSFCFV